MVINVINPWLPEPFTVANVFNHTGGVTSFDVVSPSGKNVEFLPGQFNMLYAFGIGEIPISISGGGKKFFHHTVRSVGHASEALIKLNPGMKVGVRGPYGTSWPIETAKGKNLVIFAGGLGLAPVRPVIEYAYENLKEFKSCHLLYGTKSPKELIFVDDWKKWKDDGIQAHVIVDHSDHNWKGRVGVITKLIPLIDIDWNNTIAMICGPEIMMRFVAQELELKGLPKNQIYVSLERNMKCAFGQCGHCQFGAEFLCKDGPVFSYDKVAKLMTIGEL